MIICRGVEIESGHFSGCGGGEDCPTCEGEGLESTGCPNECGGTPHEMYWDGWYQRYTCPKCNGVDDERPADADSEKTK